MSHNQNNDIMKPTDYIEWDNLKNIPFFLCQVVEDKENKDIDIYYLGKRVFHDYDHVGHYMRSAIILFRRIKNRTADWVNLQNLWTLRNCIRENYNHGIGVDSLVMNKNSLELFSLLSENSHVTDEQMQNAYKSFVEQITTISQSQQSYPEVFRMLNRTRIELDSLESSSLYELEKK